MRNIIKVFASTVLSVFLIFVGTTSSYAVGTPDASESYKQSDALPVESEWMMLDLGKDFRRPFEQADKQNQTYCLWADASVLTPAFAPEGKPDGAGSKGVCMRDCLRGGNDPLTCVACCLDHGPGVCGGDPGGGR